MSPLLTPPTEDQKPTPHVSRKPSKLTKHSSRSSKRTTISHENGPAPIDGRHKRVWKACERCRMKKTKCDGESPCKRCKDDGLVCTAGSRKKTEFKQLPRGYAEVLENTQYALIATVQKLYTMLRNNESWELGEPEMNERGHPVIHDIASKLGCIRPSPDLPYSFPEGEQDFADLQAQLQEAQSDLTPEEGSSRKPSTDDSSCSPGLDRAERASSTESDHSNMSKEYNQMMMSQANSATRPSLARKSMPASIRTNLNNAPQRSPWDDSMYLTQTPLGLGPDTSRSIPSPAHTSFTSEGSSPYTQWATPDDFLNKEHMLVQTGAQLMRQQQLPRPSPLGPSNIYANSSGLYSPGFDGNTIRPNMLDFNPDYEDVYPMDMDINMIYGDYDNRRTVP
ncbi:Zn2/Cys6 DNA-binding protein [Glarea lozoyensis ATCC 20868]|uniref:Zn2/Cys6 DNA-binding protein n=1 Tax=Glarea lozoyensis (strain ATCC 20868 / MF5171) TaxID=1116229 RepID=S3CDT8_GLAL2|nr:Zn2/Cys6 DNA-binding protein [Glarea lozoyensis ATCC 20868]EPE24180.1 Zn2/Cys6 DNA-binding protein [Glarea lozoyensis ATCC 20868]